MFELHPKLAEDCFRLGQFELSQLLMMNDYHYPWFILVPQQADIKEMYQLTTQDQIQLTKESSFLAEVVQQSFKATKMNIAALGNMVPQLHIHVIARFNFDTAWPHPVWGRAQALPFEKAQLLERINILQNTFKENDAHVFHWDQQWT
jgi:diadenosine tetraphosphate (Ap4A) HIT family hydrolase